jgi:hypothetical protein
MMIKDTHFLGCSDNLCRHVLRDGRLKRGESVVHHRANDITLRQDPEHFAIRTCHDDRANAPLGEDLGDLR